MTLRPFRHVCHLLRVTAAAGALMASWLFANPLEAQLFFPYTVSVEMADGVALSTDVWRNVFDDTPRPVLLRRTPYDRAISPQDAAGLLAAGFIVVSQDVRGRGDSEGDFVPFFHDKSDGRDTINWIARQEWSNGRVGMFSASAEGIVQHMAMAAAPAALSCTHIVMATHDVYEDFLPSGVWRTEFGTSWLTAIGAPSTIDTWRTHELRSDYWRSSTLSEREMAAIDHPVFIVGGFFDVFATSQSRVAEALQTHAAPASRGDVFVVLGPWTRSGIGKIRQGQLLYSFEAALPSYAIELRQYLNWCLRGAARPAYPNVRYYLTELTDELKLDSADNQMLLVARGDWRASATWPPAAARPVTLYLAGDHALATRPSESEAVVLAIDPANPTPSRGGRSFGSEEAGPYDQREIDLRPDVYVATSDAFEQTSELVGNLRAFVWAASATSDADVVVRFEAVTPSGRAILLADGVRRGRFAQGTDAVRPLTPGAATLFEVELGPLALRVPAGHAIRLAISGSSAPSYEPNPNVATPLADKPLAVTTTLSIFRDPAHPSRIELPLLSGKVPGATPAIAADAGAAVDAGPALPRADAGPQVEHRDAGPEPVAATPPPPPEDVEMTADAGLVTASKAGPAHCASQLGPGSARAKLPGGLLLMLLCVLLRRRHAHRDRARDRTAGGRQRRQMAHALDRMTGMS